MKSKIKDFTDIIAWQQAHKLVINIYSETKTFPKEETYSLIDQMRRASSSVTSNIAEGFGRQSYKEKVQFYHLAAGSLLELINQLYIAKDVGYLSKPKFKGLKDNANIVSKLLYGLIKSSKLYLSSKK